MDLLLIADGDFSYNNANHMHENHLIWFFSGYLVFVGDYASQPHSYPLLMDPKPRKAVLPSTARSRRENA
jgi:hypothetical protein